MISTTVRYPALALLLLAIAVVAEQSEPVGRVLLARGEVTAMAPDGSVRLLRRRATVHERDVLETGPTGNLQLRFDDGATLELRPGSRLEIVTYRHNRSDGPDSVLLRVLSGAIRSVSGIVGGAQYEMQTPVASIGIRGTHFETAEEPDGAWVYGVWDGGIVVRNAAGGIELGRDRPFIFARARAGEAPVGLVDAPKALAAAAAGGSEDDREEGPGYDPAAGAAPGLVAAEPSAAGPEAADDRGATPAGIADEVPVNPAEGLATTEEIASLAEDLFASGELLSEREQAALASGRERGILTFEDGCVVTGAATVGDDGGPLFVIDLDDGSLALIRAGDATVADGGQNLGGFEVSWGSFAAGDPVVFLADGSRVTEGELSGDFDFILVEAARLADLNVRATYEGELAFGRTSAGEITDFGVFFDAELDLGDGRISDGRLLLEAGGGLEEYRVSFDGLVREGQADLGVTQGIITGSAIDGTLDVDRDLSVLRGLFTQGGDGFAGGFSLQEAGNADRFARGGFIAEKESEPGAVSSSVAPPP